MKTHVGDSYMKKVALKQKKKKKIGSILKVATGHRKKGKKNMDRLKINILTLAFRSDVGRK